MSKYYNISRISQNSSINITNIAQSAITAHKLLQKTQNQLETRNYQSRHIHIKKQRTTAS